MTGATMRRWLFAALGVAGTTASFVACISGDEEAPSGYEGLVRGDDCVDQDGDGFWAGCATAIDCDDGDPAVGDECRRGSDPCATPRPGCACDTEGLHAACGRVESRVGTQITCGQGDMACTHGVWGECVVNGAVALLPNGDPKRSTAGLGAPAACIGNPCDPSCMAYPDTPTGLGNDAGIVATDAGLSVEKGEAGPPVASACKGGSSGSCAHHVCQTGGALTAGCDSVSSCVTKVCAVDPTCCSGAWDGGCVNLVATACNIECGIDATGGCVSCYRDSIDHDGDGYSFAQGDCKDCDRWVNPGAYDFPGNAVDEDCSGTADDEPTGCDVGLPFASSTAGDYAKAVDLCRTTTASATGANKKWGVITSGLVRADGSTTCSNNLQRAITTRFGDNNVPAKGRSMAVFSSGTARDRDDSGFVNPNGQYGSYNANTSSTPPTGFPKSAAGCPNGNGAYDSCGMKVQVRAPTNAKSFSYDFMFFSSEYAEWVCTAYNDSFIARYTGALNPYADKNISFDSKGNPISVNVGFFTVPGSPTAASHSVLANTGFDGTCNNNYSGASFKQNGICGGSTGWLTTSAPVNPGEVIELHFSIWDTGDHVWDSTVLVDNFRWSTQAASIGTQPTVPEPDPAPYVAGWFTRDYDASGLCPVGSSPVWGHWSWVSSTPSDSRIEYFVRTASSAAGLDTAAEVALRHSNPPGPSALASQPAVAKTSSSGHDTRNGSAVVDDTLRAAGLTHGHSYVRVRAHLIPSTDAMTAPTLNAWDLQTSCAWNE